MRNKIKLIMKVGSITIIFILSLTSMIAKEWFAIDSNITILLLTTYAFIGVWYLLTKGILLSNDDFDKFNITKKTHIL